MQIGCSVAMRLALLIGIVALTAAPSRAVQFSIDVLENGVSVGSWTAAQLGCTDTSSITASCSVQNITLGNLQITNLDLSLDSDPVVSGEIAVQNNSANPSQFTMIATLLVAPVGPLSLTGGSVAGGVTDNNGNGATLSTAAGSAFYSALIDGATYQTLFGHPTVLTVVNPFESADLVPPGAFGTPIPSQAGPAVNTSIGIKYDFILTGQDAASFTGVFVVQPVPEPGTALLLGLGLAVMARTAARRR